MNRTTGPGVWNNNSQYGADHGFGLLARLQELLHKTFRHLSTIPAFNIGDRRSIEPQLVPALIFTQNYQADQNPTKQPGGTMPSVESYSRFKPTL
jgi:hypothetical protein